MQIDVNVAQKDGRSFTAFIVEDTGIGIKKEDIPRLFDAFAQLHRNTNPNNTGTGLGLPITKNLAAMMGGWIGVESEYGKGSKFTVMLPLAEGDSSQIGKTSPEKLVRARDDTKVLVVDDNGVNIKVALAYLAKHGINADFATSGFDALKMIGASDYDLVFMDHMMPEMDGIEATMLIRDLPGGRG